MVERERALQAARMPLFVAELDLNDPDPGRQLALRFALDAACSRLRAAGGVALVEAFALATGGGCLCLFEADSAAIVRRASILAQGRLLRLEELTVLPRGSVSGPGEDAAATPPPSVVLGPERDGGSWRARQGRGRPAIDHD